MAPFSNMLDPTWCTQPKSERKLGKPLVRWHAGHLKATDPTDAGPSGISLGENHTHTRNHTLLGKKKLFRFSEFAYIVQVCTFSSSSKNFSLLSSADLEHPWPGMFRICSLCCTTVIIHVYKMCKFSWHAKGHPIVHKLNRFMCPLPSPGCDRVKFFPF